MSKKIKARDICVTATFTAMVAALSQVPIPTPFAVSVTLQTFAVALTAFLLGAKRSFAAMLCYVLLGAAGVPVFYGFGAGTATLFGPTGGFILAFPVYALILSFMFYVNKVVFKVLLAAAALTFLYVAGTAQFLIVTGSRAATAVSVFSLYFIKDVLVVAAAYFLCLRIRPGLAKFIQPSRYKADK